MGRILLTVVPYLCNIRNGTVSFYSILLRTTNSTILNVTYELNKFVCSCVCLFLNHVKTTEVVRMKFGTGVDMIGGDME